VPPTGLTVEAWVRFDDASMPTGVPYFPTVIGQNVGAQPSWLLIGFFAFAAQQAPVQPPVLGVSLAFTPHSVITSVAHAPGSFGLGLQRQPLPIPNAAGLRGLTVFGQFLFGDLRAGHRASRPATASRSRSSRVGSGRVALGRGAVGP
jgi:hypothetical protein